MAVSQIEEKILGRLARQTADDNPLLSASLYQVLGLSILLSRKLYRARRLRRLDITRDTKSLQLYHQILWLAREGLQITEVYILPYSQNGEQGPECRVMAAKLRASLYHVFCLFHNHPPVASLNTKSSSGSPRSSKGKEAEIRPESKSPKHNGRESSRRRRRASRNALRDPIPSMNSDTSYITNPYAGAQSVSPGAAVDARRTPSRPPGLTPTDISPTQASASFLLPPLNFVPMALAYFETAQHLSDTLLSAANALRLSVSLEHSAFIWNCDKDHDKARKLARQAIRDVYASQDELDDDEFNDASVLVQALGGIVRRGSNESTPRLSAASPTSNPPSRPAPIPPIPPPTRILPPIDRTIAVSPSNRRHGSPAQARSFTRTPERLSTVPEDPSQETSETAATTISPSVSRLSSRSKQRRGSSTSAGSDKAAKRRAVEEAEELYRRSSNRSNGASQSHSRQNTPPDGRRTAPRSDDTVRRSPQRIDSTGAESHERRQAVLTALSILSARRRVDNQSGRDVGIAF
ncbi:hypothetical protein AMS68_007222 [Peltaster fructicola]|uniref:14-3-3 domain-containing protein n=1 Tax=Peltaster fructicola TaxID=286661 RepID=A0A6H0Y452_9PEZI|nr:hypothetical protein AMS68_007222 [Peltaster fructicola]